MSRIVNLLRLKGKPICQQLQLEEAILRRGNGNWCVLNSYIEEPAIVMGISAKIDEVIHRDRVLENGVKAIRRYSGGGTVVVDKDTLFVTLILEASTLPKVASYPRPIMKWSEEFYTPIFSKWGKFSLKENDYAFNDLKFGGNAQSITKNRWVHHTSFLWNYDPSLMQLLRSPPRQPAYRQNRSHDAFLCRLKDYIPSQGEFFDGVQEALKENGFGIEEVQEEDVEGMLQDSKQIKSTKFVEL